MRHLEQHSFPLWFIVLTVLLCHLPFSAHADTKVITAEGTYTMGDGETPFVAELRALQQAKRMAVEQAGTYVQSYSKAKHYDLTADEIETISAGLIEVEVLEKKRQLVGDGLQFSVKIKASVTVEKADELVSRLRQKSSADSPNLVSEYKKLKDDYARLATEMDTLKRQMAEAKSEQEKQQTARLFTQQERQYQARAVFEKCWESYKVLGTPDSIACVDTVIRLDPSFADAWAYRALNKYWRNDYEGSIADYTEAIRLDPKPERYYDRGVAFDIWEKPDHAIMDFSEAIRLNPQDGEAYRRRAQDKYLTGHYSEALSDFTDAIRLNSVTHKDDFWDPLSELHNLVLLYEDRGSTYMKLGQYQKAVADFTTELQLLDRLIKDFHESPEAQTVGFYPLKKRIAVNLLKRGKAYSLLKRDDEAMRDYRQACALWDGKFYMFESKEACDLLKGR